MEIELWAYQRPMVDGLREKLRTHRSSLLVCPTGGGKTVIFSYMSGRASERGSSVGIFAHRDELIDQIDRTLTDFRIPHGIFAAGDRKWSRDLVQINAVGTYARRVRDNRPTRKFKLAIPDEAHHAIAGSQFHSCLTHNEQAKWVGVTATPQRLDGRGLGDTFESIVIGPSVAELIEFGRQNPGKGLSTYKLYAPTTIDATGLHKRGGDYARDEAEALMDRPTITGDAVAHYQRLLPGRRAVTFCTSIAHANHVAEQFRASGVVAMTIDGKMEKGLRKQVVRDFRDGRVQVLSSCDVVSEGFDLPGIEAAILLRPTQSLGLYLQQVGRALRPAAGKTHATILDHVGNWQRHGLPDDDREWSLDGAAPKKPKQPGEVENRQCTECYAVMPGRAVKCSECGHSFVVTPRAVEEVAGELAEVDTETVRRQRSPEVVARLREQGRADSLEKLAEVGRMRGMKNPEGWARHVLAAREAKRA